MTTVVTLPDGSRVNFPDDMSHDDMVSAIDQHLNQNPQSPQSPPPSGPVSAAQDLLQQITAAQQNTSPVVRDEQGNLNYTRLGNPIDTDAGPGYVDSGGKWQIVDPSRHVLLTDPATSRAGVFERNEGTEESRAASLGRMASLGILSGSPTVAGATRLPGQTSTMAGILSSSPAKMAANAAGAYGVTELGGLLGLPGEAAGMIGASLGLGSHASGMGAQALDNLARWFSARAASGAPAVPAVNYGSPFSVPGLLGYTLGAPGATAGYPYSTP
jgi:hypothetical protein